MEVANPGWETSLPVNADSTVQAEPRSQIHLGLQKKKMKKNKNKVHVAIEMLKCYKTEIHRQLRKSHPRKGSGQRSCPRAPAPAERGARLPARAGTGSIERAPTTIWKHKTWEKCSVCIRINMGNEQRAVVSPRVRDEVLCLTDVEILTLPQILQDSSLGLAKETGMEKGFSNRAGQQ